jgi:DNA-binding response OmpR family regulator
MNPSTALIIEDDPDLAAIFSRALQVGGFQTEAATNGKKALAFLENNIPNIIVLDLHLPDIDGMEILYKIRAEERLAKSKVIVASADAQLVKLADNMADLVLIKPVSVSQLKDLALRLNINPE